MGKDNGNTTNSWLNLPKILELTLNNGKSLLTGKALLDIEESPAGEILRNLRGRFYANLDIFLDEMAEAANGAAKALANLPVPFLSACMGGLETGIDLRDTQRQGTKYNGSGCLIHGLSVMADSFVAVDHLLKDRPEDAERLLKALRSNFEDDPELLFYLKACPKFGNNLDEPDSEAVMIAQKVSDMVSARKNYLGNPFRADWSTPSTHLLYGYWVGATPDGRPARSQLNYGVDPLFGEAEMGLGLRVLSAQKLPYASFKGGYASHLGLDPRYFTAPDFEGRGEQFFEYVLKPLFFAGEDGPFYLYVNVTTPETLRKVLANPKKYAPSGVYIMRIHGTFVNFLDLSPAIQQDIIARLDLESTSLN
jgi:formate C-acetyltransferase